MKKQYDNSLIERHPCFSEKAHEKYGRIHLPIAPQCNISCNYCDRKYDCVNESRPGISSRLLSPSEAFDRVKMAMERNSNISVVGVAGPGEPLANKATFDFLKMVSKEFPELNLCISTNGLLLFEKINLLQETGVKTITVTVNAFKPETAEKIYSWIIHNGKLLKGKKASKVIIRKQLEGLTIARKKGFTVKVNTVLIPGINNDEILKIAQLSSDLGVFAMNIIPLIPNGKFRSLKKPSCEEIERIIQKCSEYIQIIRHCKQCRADAYGSLNEEKDMELEMVYKKLSDFYNDYVF